MLFLRNYLSQSASLHCFFLSFSIFCFFLLSLFSACLSLLSLFVSSCLTSPPLYLSIPRRSVLSVISLKISPPLCHSLLILVSFPSFFSLVQVCHPLMFFCFSNIIFFQFESVYKTSSPSCVQEDTYMHTDVQVQLIGHAGLVDLHQCEQLKTDQTGKITPVKINL